MASNLRRRTNVVFYQIAGVGVFTLIFFIAFGFILFSRLDVFLKAAQLKLEAICGCTNHLSFAHHPYLLTFLILLGFLFIIFSLFILKETINYGRATSKYVNLKIKSGKKKISVKLRRAAIAAGLGGRVIETAEKNASVFCFGFLKPKICLSAELVKKLNRNELSAVLLHEKQHLLNYEPAKLFLVKSIVNILFFIPSLKLLADKYFILSELTADERATGGFRNKTPLAGALIKAIKLEEGLAGGSNLAVSFLSIASVRINKLLDDRYAPKFKVFTARILISSLLPLLILLSFIFIADSSQALIKSHDVNFCPAMQKEERHQCQLAGEQAACGMSYNNQASQCLEK